MATKRGPASDGDKAPITIKKYANRRLYNTLSSAYVTLEDLAAMVREGSEFQVFDAKTGEDITRSVLTQIIVEQEAKGHNLLPVSFLRQLIGLYGDSLQGVVPQYLELTMQSFMRNQEQMRRYLNDAFGGMFPFSQFEEMSRQNMAMFEQAMKMFAPFQGRREGKPQPPPEERADDTERALRELKSQMESMQARIDALSRTRDK